MRPRKPRGISHVSRGVRPELSGVGEQQAQADANVMPLEREEILRSKNPTRALIRHHRARMRANLGELPEAKMSERAIRGPIQETPPANPNDWLNPYTQSNFPFIVGTASIQILPANPLRCYLLIQNKSAGNMYVNFGQNANTFNGIQIITIGNYELIGGARGGAFCPSDGIYIIGDAASLSGVVTEGVIMPSMQEIL